MHISFWYQKQVPANWYQTLEPVSSTSWYDTLYCFLVPVNCTLVLTMVLIIVEMHQNLQTRALYLEQSPQTPILSGVENGKMGTGGTVYAWPKLVVGPVLSWCYLIRSKYYKKSS